MKRSASESGETEMWGCTDTGREPQHCQISCFTPLLLSVQISPPKSRICTVQIAKALKVKLGIRDIKKKWSWQKRRGCREEVRGLSCSTQMFTHYSHSQSFQQIRKNFKPALKLNSKEETEVKLAKTKTTKKDILLPSTSPSLHAPPISPYFPRRSPWANLHLVSLK